MCDLNRACQEHSTPNPDNVFAVLTVVLVYRRPTLLDVMVLLLLLCLSLEKAATISNGAYSSINLDQERTRL